MIRGIAGVSLGHLLFSLIGDIDASEVKTESGKALLIIGNIMLVAVLVYLYASHSCL